MPVSRGIFISWLQFCHFAKHTFHIAWLNGENAFWLIFNRNWLLLFAFYKLVGRVICIEMVQVNNVEWILWSIQSSPNASQHFLLVYSFINSSLCLPSRDHWCKTLVSIYSHAIKCKLIVLISNCLRAKLFNMKQFWVNWFVCSSLLNWHLKLEMEMEIRMEIKKKSTQNNLSGVCFANRFLSWTNLP